MGMYRFRLGFERNQFARNDMHVTQSNLININGNKIVKFPGRKVALKVA